MKLTNFGLIFALKTKVTYLQLITVKTLMFPSQLSSQGRKCSFVEIFPKMREITWEGVRKGEVLGYNKDAGQSIKIIPSTPPLVNCQAQFQLASLA